MSAGQPGGVDRGSKQQPFSRVLYALGIPGIGFVNARNLAAHFRTIDALMTADAERSQTPGVGPIMARPRRDAGRGRTRELIERLRGYGLQIEEEGPAPVAEGPLVGKTLVLTGTLPNLTRDQATERIEAAAAR